MALRSCSRPSVPAHRCAVRRGRAAPRAATASGGESFSRRVVDTAGAWLVAHPAPLWLVNNPVKRLFTTASAGDYDVAATQEELRRLIDSDGVVLFSATYCPFSAQVKRDLAAQRVPYTVYETNVLPNGAALVAELGRLTGRTSIPHVFIAGASIGGCNDGSPGLRPLIAQGGLEEALSKSSPEYQAQRRLLFQQ